MTVHCPQCGAPIPTADVNVATDVAACRRCDAVFKLSELATPASSVPLDFRTGAATRSPIAFYLVPFMLVWSGGSAASMASRS